MRFFAPARQRVSAGRNRSENPPMHANRLVLPVCRFGFPVLSRLLICLVLAASGAADDDANTTVDMEIDENADGIEPEADDIAIDQVEDPGEFDELVYATEWEAAAANAKERLESMLAERVEYAGWMGELTDAQRERLLLAGRGDLKRLLERAAEWKSRRRGVRDAGDPLLALNELVDEARSLRARFTR